MSLQGYVLEDNTLSLQRGPQRVDPDTGTTMVDPVLYNVKIPTGSAERDFVTGSTSVTIIDPNGEGTCKPRLVATSSFSFKIINDTTAVPGAPFTAATAEMADITKILTFFGSINYPVPAAA